MSEIFWKHSAINYAALAIPGFFLFLAIEYLVARRQKRLDIFKFESSVANISIGIAERLLNLFITAGFYGVFLWVYENYAIWNVPNTWIIWVILILATDLVWYWYHRLGHEVNLLWAAHIVHHQSEEFNYSVSARITTIQAIIRNVFWCVLPLAGFHPAMVMTILVLHGTYSFFTHTQLIQKLGWLEHILITPSHHRVHHASNEKYLNKNYGDLFVFWDRLFGTFQREEEEPVYGLTHPLKRYSFIWQHIHYFLELLYATTKANGITEKLRIVFGKPELLDQSIRAILERKFIPNTNRVKPVRRFKVYLIVQVVISVLLLFVVTLFFQDIGTVDRFVYTSFILITLINCGAMLEQRRWIYYLEYIRLILIMGYLSIWVDNVPAFFLGGILIFILSMSDTSRRLYLKFVYG